MSLRNRNPSEPRSSDTSFPVVRGKFYGMITGEPSSEIPNAYAERNYNVIDRGEYFNVRSGSKRYTLNKLGYKVTIDSTSDEITTERNHPWITGDVIYFKGEELPAPIVEKKAFFIIKIDEKKIKVASSYNNAILGIALNIISNGYGNIWAYFGQVNAFCDHVDKKKLIFQFGESVYTSNKSMSEYEKAINLSDKLTNDTSMIVSFGDYSYLANKSGLFKINLEENYLIKMNTQIPDTLIQEVKEDAVKIWGYLYIYGFAKMANQGDRTSGSLIEMETGTCQEQGKEKDYSQIYFTYPIGEDLTRDHVIGDFSLPEDLEGITHYPLYRSKNIGENSGGVSSSVEGIGNRRDQFVWCSDIPVAKAFAVKINDGMATVFKGNKFDRGDVGSTLVDINGNEIKILAFNSDSCVDVNINTNYGETVIYCAIGGGRVSRASQSKGILNVGGSFFSPEDVGRIVFISDGTFRYIKRFIDILNVEVNGNDFSGLAITLKPLVGNFSRKWNDCIPDMPQIDGRVSLQDRIEYGSDLYIPRRFFSPIPDGNIIFIDNGFCIISNRDSNEYYYSQIGDKEYSLGQYRNDIQTRKISGSVRHIVGFPYRAVIFCKNQTGVINLTSSQNVGRTEIGENVFQLPEMSVIDPKIGVIAWRTIVFKNSIIYALTNDVAYRYFDGNSWSKEDLAFINGLDAVSKRYLKLVDQNAILNANYSANGGLKAWLKKKLNIKKQVTYKVIQFVVEGEQDYSIQFDSQTYRDRGNTGLKNIQFIGV